MIRKSNSLHSKTRTSKIEFYKWKKNSAFVFDRDIEMKVRICTTKSNANSCPPAPEFLLKTHRKKNIVHWVIRKRCGWRRKEVQSYVKFKWMYMYFNASRCLLLILINYNAIFFCLFLLLLSLVNFLWIAIVQFEYIM